MYFAARLLPTALLSTLSSARGHISTTCKANLMHQNLQVGLGTFGIPPEQVADAIHSALKVGYRRIDCAPVYFNEDRIGDSLVKELEEGSVTREELYVVSKLACPFHRKEHVKIGLQKTLTDLRVDYLDLYLMHWPQAFQYVEIDPSKRGYDNEDIDESDGGALIDTTVSVHETWAAMEELVDEGLVKSIGVSNFPVSLLHELMTRSRIPPAVNQVEAHPYLQQTKLMNYCKARGVQFQAYSPLGTPGYKEDGEPNILDDPVLKSIATTHNTTVAGVCIGWALQRGTSVVTKSSSEVRQRANLEPSINTINFSDSEIAQIESLERGHRFFRPEDWWGSMALAAFD